MDYPDSNKINQQSLHFGHIGIIAFCAMVLIALTFIKGGFHFSLGSANPSFSNALTYEQAKQETFAVMGSAPNIQAGSSQAQNQIAMLDPNLQQGSVLGTSTGVSDLFPAAETVFTPDVLGQIKINLQKNSGPDSVQIYANQISALEADSDVLSMISDLNSDDAKILAAIPDKTKKMVEALAKISVPSDLAEYHRLKMVYYTTFGNLATNLSGQQGLSDTDSATTLFFSLTDRLERIRTEILNKYNLTLP